MIESEFHHAGCCGRKGAGLAVGALAARREPFAFPGTSKKYARDRVVDVEHVRLDVAVDPAARTIAGTATHTVAALVDGCDRVSFDAVELVIEGVRDGDGRPLAFEHRDGVVCVRLSEPLATGARTSIAIAYHGSPRRGIYFIAPDAAYPGKPLEAWTQGQDEDARYWFPCFDAPIEKTTTEMVVTVPSKFTTLSNGALLEKRAGAAKGTTTWHWKMAIPHVSYLVTLAVGEFDRVELPGGPEGLPLYALVPKGSAKVAARCLGRTGDMVKAFSARFGVAYPYEQYAQVVVSDFIFGGMENTTATTLTEYALYDERAALDYDADDLVAHELGHQWWGDLLTCRDWSHAWLNEGFATFCEEVYREHRLGTEEARQHVFAAARRYMAEDGGEYRRPIVSKDFEEPIDIFDRHLYEKGGWVLHMLRAEVGDELFWKSIGHYARSNAGKSVVTEDLRRAFEETTGRSLEWFFDQWIYGAGHPELKASWSYDEKQGVATIKVEQGQAADATTPVAFRGTMTVELVAGERRETRRLAIVDRAHAFHVPFPSKPERVRFDPEGEWLAAWTLDLGLDAHRATLASDPSVVLRMRAAVALAKDSSEPTIAALARALRSDAFWAVGAEAAAALGEIRTPAAREALLAALSAVKHPKARRAVVTALGAFRGDEAAGTALRGVLEKGDASLFVEADAAEALGRTRVAFAREVLEKALSSKDSWADTIRAGAVRGLGSLASEAALPALFARLARGNHPRVRTAAALSLATIGARLVVRDAIRERLEEAIDDRDFRVQMAAIAALRTLGDDRAIPALRRGAEQATDGRVKRACRATARRLEQGAVRTQETARLSDAVEALRRENGELKARLEKLESVARPSPSSAKRTVANPSKKAPPRKGRRK